MKYRFRLLALLALLALLVVAAGIAVRLSASRLPDPAAANRDQLLRWVVTRDLAQESPATRRTLADRLEQEFQNGVDWAALSKKMTEAQRQQIWNNIPLLLGPWLEAKAATYSDLPDANRSKFLDQFIETISAWRGAERLQPQQNAGSPGQPPGLVTVLLGYVESHRGQLEPQQRQQMEQFLSAVKKRFWMKAIGL